jgi:cyclase
VGFDCCAIFFALRRVSNRMLKVRVAGLVLVRNGIAVQSIGFERFLPLGRPEIAIEYLDRWGIDEIVLLHIDAAASGHGATAVEVASYSAQCRVPLAVGGGILEIADVHRAIKAGADKIVVNRAVVERPALIEEAATQFGSQCIIASIDAVRGPDGTLNTVTHGGRRRTGFTPAQLAKRAESAGAGEIMITSVDRDGSLRGYDLDLIEAVVKAVGIPVIGCGGAGHPDHLRDGIQRGAAAVAAGNFFHYTEQSVILVKQALTRAVQPVRLDSYVDYAGHTIDSDGRLGKQSDHVLETLRFRYIPEEVI